MEAKGTDEVGYAKGCPHPWGGYWWAVHPPQKIFEFLISKW